MSTDHAALALVKAGNLLQPEKIAVIAADLSDAEQLLAAAGDSYWRNWGAGIGRFSKELTQYVAMLTQVGEEIVKEANRLAGPGRSPT